MSKAGLPKSILKAGICNSQPPWFFELSASHRQRCSSTSSLELQLGHGRLPKAHAAGGIAASNIRPPDFGLDAVAGNQPAVAKNQVVPHQSAAMELPQVSVWTAGPKKD